MHNLQTSHTEAAIVEYHVNWPSAGDPFYLYNTMDNNGRKNYYSVSGVPMMKVDGRYTVSTGNLLNTYNTRYDTPSPVQMSIIGSYDSDTREVSATILMMAVEDMPDDNYVLRVALTETGIYYNTNYNDNHYNVMRDMFPSYVGTAVTLATGVQEQYSLNFTLPTSVPPNNGIVEENARLVAFIQPAAYSAPNYREVQQAVWEWVLDLDATGSEPAPARFALESNYPNPFNPVTTIPVQVEKNGPALLEILTVDGRRVTVLHEGELSAGTHEFQWNGTDDAGRSVASGVYLAQLVGQTEKHMQRMVLLK